MSANSENLMNPGIFVRAMDDGISEVLWLDGHGVIEKAFEEEESYEWTIPYFLKSVGHHDFDQDIYDEWGVHQSTVTLRNITLRESVAFLGRDAKICVFLRPKEQAIRFVRLLREGGVYSEQGIADQISKQLVQFDIHARKMYLQRAAEMIATDKELGLL